VGSHRFPTAVVQWQSTRGSSKRKPKLKANDIPGMMAILNALRAHGRSRWGAATSSLPSGVPTVAVVSSGVMPVLPDPANATDATTLLFREKAFWTFSRGMRLGDLRRFDSSVQFRTEDVVFPSGDFP